MAQRNGFLLLAVAALFLALRPPVESQSFIGVNYGEVADNLPPPEATVRLLKSTTIAKLRLYGADSVILRALADTNISVVIGAANGEIPSLASDPSAARRWVAANVLPFLPATAISLVSVGNEVLGPAGSDTLAPQLLPAMRNLHAELSAAAPSAGVKVSTVHSMAVLAASEPPSVGAFGADLASALGDVLAFLRETGSPFMVNPYPYFAYQSDPRPETLAFCLFRPNPGRFDAGSGLTYANMFDAQVDAVRSALKATGFGETEVVVAETGWPYRGDAGEVGATVENAKAFNGGLIAHLRSMAGTPLVPGRSVDTYIFALYDEDLKPGPASERAFGLFRTDLTPTYDAGLEKTGAMKGNSTGGPARKPAAAHWCVPKAEAREKELQENLDYACGQEGVDCRPIQERGACYLPNTVRSHAAYAMNQLYQVTGRHTRLRAHSSPYHGQSKYMHSLQTTYGVIFTKDCACVYNTKRPFIFTLQDKITTKINIVVDNIDSVAFSICFGTVPEAINFVYKAAGHTKGTGKCDSFPRRAEPKTKNSPVITGEKTLTVEKIHTTPTKKTRAQRRRLAAKRAVANKGLPHAEHQTPEAGMLIQGKEGSISLKNQFTPLCLLRKNSNTAEGLRLKPVELKKAGYAKCGYSGKGS